MHFKAAKNEQYIHMIKQKVLFFIHHAQIYLEFQVTSLSSNIGHIH